MQFQTAHAGVPLENLALFLDLDGTLAPIVSNPDAVKIDARRRELLSELSEAVQGRLAIISGRTIPNVDRILKGGVQCVAGVHGLQRRSAEGATMETAPHARLAEATETLRAFAKAERRLLLESKAQSVALHYRNHPKSRAAVIELAERVAQTTGLVIQHGDHVVELLTPGGDKGAAVRAFMGEAPFEGATPVFIGDDLTDEHGFAAARELGGAAIKVGDAHEVADAALASPDEVYDRLEQALRIGVFNIGEREWSA